MFSPAKSNKISQVIVDQIRGAIFEGKLKPGDRLPSEGELMEKFRVSKATLREGLRSLEVLGLLEIRKGASGGSFVREVDLKKVRECLTNFLLFKNLSLRNITEVRLALEPYVAEKAAHLISEEDLVRLEASIKKCDDALKSTFRDPDSIMKGEIEFHRIVASAIRNPVMTFVVDFMGNLLFDSGRILRPGTEFFDRVEKAHRRIYKALSKRDAVKARDEMFKHIQEVDRDFLAI